MKRLVILSPSYFYSCCFVAIKQTTGFLFGLFLVLIFSARFALEFFKTPQAAYEAGNLITVDSG